MADRLPGKTRVPAPAARPYPLDLLSVLEAQGLLHDAPEGSHLQNGVFWVSDAAAGVKSNDDVVYSEGSFESENKTIQHGFEVTDGFGFELSRYVQLGFGAGGSMEEQRARAERRFAVWESYDVARHLAAFFLSTGLIPPYTVDGPVEAVSMLLQVMSAVGPNPKVWGEAPMLFSGRGLSVRLLKDSVVERAGATYAPDNGFATVDTQVPYMFATGTVSVWRTPLTVIPVPNPKVNEGDVLVERAYYVVIDGPIYGVKVPYPTPTPDGP